MKADRLRALTFTAVSGYTSTMIGLNELWYKDFSRTGFHFFNDNKQWLQVDKIGHATTSYYVGKVGMDALKWSGVPSDKAILYGSSFGLIFLTSLEIFDGVSAEWGASFGDLAANTFGTGLLVAQHFLWKEQKILLKFSFSPSGYSQYRPDLLGRSLQEQMLKDYNGQTYWFSMNAASLIKSSFLPGWLNLSLGYGGDGMLGGSENPALDYKGNNLPSYKRSRQFYFSLDVDLTKIKTKSVMLQTLLNSFGFIKFPSPALELRGNKLMLHPLFF